LRFAEALAFAEDLHAYQTRKERGTPHIAHVLAVSGTVMEYGGNEAEGIAALLLEAPAQGGAGTISRIRDRFGDRVAQIVHTLSDASVSAHPSAPWVEMKRAHLHRLRTAGDVSVFFVSAVDRMHAVRCALHSYRTAGESIWLNYNSGKPGFVWYHEEMVDVYRNASSDVRRSAVVDEIAETVERIKKYNPAAFASRTIHGRAETGEAAAL
jgi:(p)ppGpp synthase/HD superfamily hydrolase